MYKFNFLLFLILSFLFFSCGSNSGKKVSPFSLKIAENRSEFQLGESIEAFVENRKNKRIDSISFFFENELIKTLSQDSILGIHLENRKLGRQKISAIVFFEGERDTISTSIKIFNNSPPVSYSYRIINAYPHDQNAYTQGLEIHNDTLYESTGQYGSSSLRKVDLKTGEIIAQINLAENYFGEGITILNNKIYQLTWNEGEGLIYDLEDFKRTGTFNYNQSEEGWGLCNDGEKLYKSDGTDKIWILDPDDLSEESFIQITTHKNIVSKMNELEWVDGKIYANTYQKDGVAIINSKNGAIEGLIDFRGLRHEVSQHDQLDVLNGIAYNPKSQKLYVTGKNWNKIFEVEIVKK